MSIMGGHKTVVKAIKINPSGKEAISISSEVAQVWNLSTFERLRRLGTGSNILWRVCFQGGCIKRQPR